MAAAIPADTPANLPHLSASTVLAMLCQSGRRQVVAWLLDAATKTAAENDTHLASMGNEFASKLDRGSEQLGQRLLERCQESGVSVCIFGALEFPAWLTQIPDPPAVLFFRGDLTVLREPAVAVVGARQCTRYGEQSARRLGRDLATSGVTVVSGLALGIDAAAHRGALDGHGATVAVLGCGHGHDYPRRNAPLARQIEAGAGLLLSEYAPDVGPRKHHFPERNRLISGLSRGVVIVEATEKSGSLITARMAAEQGREVLAFPGLASSDKSSGCHRLIRDGAALVTSAADVLAELDWVPRIEPSSPASASRKVGESFDRAPFNGVPSANVPLTDAEQQVLACLDVVPRSLDDVAADIDLAPEQVTAALVGLELSGFVDALNDGYIRRPYGFSD